MFRRVARAVAEPDAAYGYDAASTEESFYGLLDRACASSPIRPPSPARARRWASSPHVSCCPISDDMGKRSDGIFQTLRDAALIQQTGGGNGFSFSRLRPKGDSRRLQRGRRHRTGRLPAGVRHGVRRGGPGRHAPRRQHGRAARRSPRHRGVRHLQGTRRRRSANFNISVGITDAFMQAVEDDADFPLVNPRDGKVWRTVRARDLFDKIVTYAHHNGEPGALFLDAANRSNPVPHLYELEATNPCGEQWLGPYENCCLGSINLAQHVTADGQVDWDKLRESAVVSHALPGQRGRRQQVRAGRAATARGRAARPAHRPGHHGAGRPDVPRWACATARRKARSSPPRSWSSCATTACRPASSWPQERGPFLAIKGSIYDPDDLKWQPPAAAHAVRARLGPPRPRLGRDRRRASGATASATPRRPPSRPPAPSAPWPAARATAASRSSPWPTPARSRTASAT